jgi:hypothetical protein
MPLEQPNSAVAESLVHFVCFAGFDAIASELDPRQRSALVRTVEI